MCVMMKKPTIGLRLPRYRLGRNQKEQALQELRKAVDENPRFLLVRKLMGQIMLEDGLVDEGLEQYRDLIDLIETNPREFQCTHCGYSSSELTWKCPQCLNWDTVQRKEIN